MLVDVSDFLNRKLNNINRGYVNSGWGQSSPTNDELVKKVCDFFNNRIKTEPLSPDDGSNPEWLNIVNRHRHITNALQNYDLDFLNKEFANLFESSITNGTTQGSDQTNQYKSASPEVLYNHTLYVYDKLLDVMESTGILTAFSPEEYFWVKDYDSCLIHPDLHLEKLMSHYKVDLSAPKYAGMLFGLQTSYGVYSIKDVHALGLALQLYDKFKDNLNIKICEIGGGVGQLAYYMTKFGFKNYNIVDLPTISVSQMYFLGSNLPDNNVSFVSPTEFNGKYDVVINVDSLPEIPKTEAFKYLKKISKNCPYFLSINQERRKTFLVQDLCRELGMKRLSRNLFWFRKGYIMEEWKKS